MMRKILCFRMAIIFLATLLIFSSVFFALQREEFVEPWEKRLNRNQPPVKIMDAIGLKEGMVIGDIGAGRGRFTVWFADRVGPNGKVYANDIVENYLHSIEQRCRRLGFTNVITCLGTVVEPHIPEEVLDIAFMINVYHHLEKPVELLKNLIPALKKDGILVIVERTPEKSRWASEATPKDKLIKQADQAGYTLEKIETFLAEDYIYFFKNRNATSSENIDKDFFYEEWRKFGCLVNH
jgi:arsenite methyltransferase